jgi:hypothetical protein
MLCRFVLLARRFLEGALLWSALFVAASSAWTRGAKAGSTVGLILCQIGARSFGGFGGSGRIDLAEPVFWRVTMDANFSRSAAARA